MVEKYTNKNIKTNFACPGVTEYNASNVPMVSEIDLPDGTKYTFTYEGTPSHSGYYTGRLASVTLPTGGQITYGYSGGYSGYGISCADGSTATLTRNTPDGSGTYAHSEPGTQWSTLITDPQGNQTGMAFQGIYETERTVYQGSTSGPLLETVDTCYNGASIPCMPTAVTLPISNRTVQVTLLGFSPSKIHYTAYNTTYGLPTETDEYTYGSSLVRKTTISYTGCGVTNSFIHDRPCSVKVYDNGGVLKAENDYTYDGTTGNLLTETRSTGGSPATISRSFTYSSGGVLHTATDFNTNRTTYTNTACNSAFPTTITAPPPFSFTSSITWGCNGGVVNSVKDANNETTTIEYTDANFWRVTKVDYPDQGNLTTTYTDTQGAFSVAGSRLVSTGVNHLTTQTLDGLGRVNQAQDNSAGTYVDRHYDSLGRVYSVSNPHFSGGSPSDGITYYSYDALGRPADVGTAHAIKYPDGNYTSITYSGYCATAADPAGKTRTTCTDALGRTTSVTEDPNGLNYQTTYTYDALGNLKTVTQGTQTRTYNYDRLSRLTQAVTPESGTTNFYYTTSGGALCSGDPNAVCRRTDARGITTTYAYDALNRLTGKTYSDSTPPVTSSYDQTSVTIGSWSSGTLANPLGRMTQALTTSGGNVQTAVVYSYDPMGRPADYWQCTPFNCGNASIWHSYYHYDLAGDNDWWTHPAGFTITNSISPAQRITQISSSLSDSTHPQFLAQNMAYTPWGALSTLQNGCAGTGCTNIQETYDYNSRLQPVRFQLGTSGNPAANYCLVYNYYSGQGNPSSCAVPSQPTTGNNGNMTGYWYQDNANSSLSHTATYGYDNVNRLTSAVATGSSTYNLTFNYDRFGNMRCVTNGQTNGPCPNWTFDTSTNRISTSGFTYDAAGDLTADGTHSYQWDAEGRMSQIDGGATNTWAYNALGQWVYWQTGDSPQYLYDPWGRDLAYFYAGWLASIVPLGGRPLAAYPGSYWGNVMSFSHVNALGSDTQRTDYSGAVQSEALFYPWGQFWFSQGLFASFTDVDMGTINLDAGRARNYSYTSGRWMSPDPLAGDVTNPQSLNRYAYVLNNPATLTDPLGLDPPGCPQGMPTQECYGGIPGFWASSAPQFTFSSPTWDEFTATFYTLYSKESGFFASRIDPYGLLLDSLAMLPVWPRSDLLALAPLVPRSAEDLNNPSTFSSSSFATPDQVAAFIEAQPNAPNSWNGLQAGYAFSGAGLNSGLAVGIIGAETSFGNSGLSQYNINNPFSAGTATNFTSSMSGALGTIMRLESTTYTPGSPLTALTNQLNILNQAYTTTQQGIWRNNVNSWFRKFAKSIGKCI